MLNDDSISLNKFISDTGVCSRREADRLIAEGRVSLNGQIAQKGNRAIIGDHVTIDGKPIATPEKPIYIAFNKPVGVTCTTDLADRTNIISYLKHPKRIFPIGRLDKPSEGLIFLTNDGNIVNKILRAGNNHEKEYLVMVDKPITPQFLQRMREGVPILDIITQKCRVAQVDTDIFAIILTQGLNRQIRRMCTALGYEVLRLRRERIMHISLEGIAVGKWRNLTNSEVAEIHRLVANSTKTEEGSRLATEADME